MKLLYLNANILYGECLRLISKRNWKRKIKSSVTSQLLSRGFSLTTSILTKTEIIQRLIREENCSIKQARDVFLKILREFEIILISSLNKRNLLTNTFMDIVAISNLDFKDAIHLDIASKNKITVVTHDKKLEKTFQNIRIN